MSSDFLEDVECEGDCVLLSMRASGGARLTILEGSDDKYAEYQINPEDEIIASFPLNPDQTGIDNAKKIADALMAWSEHIQRSNLVQG